MSATTSPESLPFHWRDAGVVRLGFHDLRCSCGCAHCVHEITGQKLLDPANVPRDIHIEHMALVGNYALKIFWSDGHSDGLFTWDVLRRLCDAI